MNILHVLPGKIWGGAEQYALDLGEALSFSGHHVSYLAFPTKPIESRMKDISECVFLKFDRFGSSKELIPSVKYQDVIHIHDIRHLKPVMRACDKIGNSPKFILTRHIARDSRVMPWNQKYLLRLNKMIFVSSFAKDLWLGTNSWFPAEKCFVLLNSIPSNNNPQESLRKRFFIADNTPLLIYTGRIRKSKGCDNILKALSLLKELEWEMVFIGNCKPSDYSDHLMKIAFKEGIGSRIHFYGFSTNVRGLIHEADLGLAPSIVRESFHLSPLEFMQRGVCVITSDNGAQKEYIQSNRTGILINPLSYVELSKAIRNMLVDKSKRERIGRDSRLYFENYLSYPNFLKKIIDIYERS